MVLVGFQYEPASLDVNEVYFDEKQDSPNAREKSRKSQSVTEWCRGLLLATLLKKRHWLRCFSVNFVKILRTPFYIEHLWRLFLIKCLSCGEVEVLRYFQLSDIRLSNMI